MVTVEDAERYKQQIKVGGLFFLTKENEYLVEAAKDLEVSRVPITETVMKSEDKTPSADLMEAAVCPLCGITKASERVIVGPDGEPKTIKSCRRCGGALD